MNKKRSIMLILPLILTVFCLSAFADDLSIRISALEQKAKRLQSQIQQAQENNRVVMENQILGLRQSIEALIRQRVLLDSQIAKFEAQIEEVKKQSENTLSRQVAGYHADLEQTRAQLAGMVAQSKSRKPQNPQDKPPTNPKNAVLPPVH